MRAATGIGTHRRIHGSAETGGESRPESVERLTAATRAVLDRFGVHWSGSKTSRVVRAYARTVQTSQLPIGDYVAMKIESEHQRRVVADELRKVTAYADKTGETAVNRVLRGDS